MKKSDKKLEKQLTQVLTRVCETALEQVSGFTWLTHFVNFNAFPDSLRVVCIFDTNSELELALAEKQDVYLKQLIESELASAGMASRDIKRRITFDTEENCQKENGGKWGQRFSS